MKAEKAEEFKIPRPFYSLREEKKL